MLLPAEQGVMQREEGKKTEPGPVVDGNSGLDVILQLALADEPPG